MKKFIALLILAGLGAFGWTYHKKRFGAHGNTPIAIAEGRDGESVIHVNGEVQAAAQTEVKPKIAGRIKKLYVRAGDQVKGGDLLVEIDELIEGAHEKILADLASKNNQSRADLQRAEDKLSGTRVRAPTDGRVLFVPVVEGQVVIPAGRALESEGSIREDEFNNGTTLLTIGNLSKLIVEAHVNQVDVASLAPKQTVQMTAESIPDEQMEAQMLFIAPIATVRNSVKGFVVHAIIEKPDPRLLPGMIVQMTIPSSTRRNSP